MLKRMNRDGSRKAYVRLIEKLRLSIPGITLRSAFIVGFPGETEEDFQDLLDFMAQVKLDRVGIFVYSREEGTAAAKMDRQVPEDIKTERRDRAMEIQQKISLEMNQKKIGDTVTVLVEGISSEDAGLYEGRSEGDAPDIDGRVLIKSNRDLKPGDFVKVLIESASWYDLYGKHVV
jgi:ribosomal protein S12 methylthiotransferase